MESPSWPGWEKTSTDSERAIWIRKIPHIVRLNSDLRGPIDRKGIRIDLTNAQADGFDPKDLYEKCVQAKHLTGDLKYQAPPYSEVAPDLIPPTRSPCS